MLSYKINLIQLAEKEEIAPLSNVSNLLPYFTSLGFL